MTWAEFKRLVEVEGIKDEDEIFYIDTHCPYEKLDVQRYDDNTFTVTC